jgi:hypothetical protein
MSEVTPLRDTASLYVVRKQEDKSKPESVAAAKAYHSGRSGVSAPHPDLVGRMMHETENLLLVAVASEDTLDVTDAKQEAKDIKLTV